MKSVIGLLESGSSWVMYKVYVSMLSWTHQEITRKPLNPGLVEFLGAGGWGGVDAQESLWRHKKQSRGRTHGR